MRLYEKVIFQIGQMLSRIGSGFRDFALGLHAQRVIDERRPKRPDSEPWHDNFSTREGEHDHV